MGVHPTKADAIYALLCRLPQSGLWPMVCKTIELEMQWNLQVVQAYEVTMAMGIGFSGHARASSSTSLPSLCHAASTLHLSATNCFLTLLQAAQLVSHIPFRWYCPLLSTRHLRCCKGWVFLGQDLNMFTSSMLHLTPVSIQSPACTRLGITPVVHTVLPLHVWSISGVIMIPSTALGREMEWLDRHCGRRLLKW